MKQFKEHFKTSIKLAKPKYHLDIFLTFSKNFSDLKFFVSQARSADFLQFFTQILPDIL
jgi:hypothetical protein